MDQDAVDEIADHFWEQAVPRFEGHTDRYEAMTDAEMMALDFLALNPELWRGKGLDPDELAQAIAEQRP